MRNAGDLKELRSSWMQASTAIGTQRTEHANNLHVLGSRFFPEPPDRSTCSLAS